MSSQKHHKMCVFLHVFLFVMLAFASKISQAQRLQTNTSMNRSLYSFGDSFVDPGNNDYIPTNSKSNFAPYGIDFPNKIATGRFSNGLLFPDFLAYYLGVDVYQRPYLGLQLDYKDPVTAISFASATSGYDPSTANKTKAIQMQQQLGYFRDYKAKLQKTIGRREANKQIMKALFYVNAGSDDFAFTFFKDGNGQQVSFSLVEFERSLLKRIRRFIQGLWSQGARIIAVNGLPPLGCIPVGITNLPPNPRNSKGVSQSERKCLDYVNDISEHFNSLLQDQLVDLQRKLSKTKIAYIDFEEPLLDIIQNPDDYGFNEVNKGCCGKGLTEIGLLCNATCTVCADASKYVFWDAAHPTEKTYELIFNSNLAAIDAIIEN